jgi:hypothetical protein
MDQEVVPDDWQERRVQLNHDVLCNRLLTRLVSLARTRPPEPLELAALEEWTTRRGEYSRLLEEAPLALTPASLLDAELCSELTAMERNTLRSVAHDFFLVGTQLMPLLDHLRSVLQRLVEDMERYLGLPPHTDLAAVTSLIQAATVLSNGLSLLPHSNAEQIRRLA